MAIVTPEATERWQDYRFVAGESATRVWDVVGTRSVGRALVIRPVARKNESHELDSRLIARAPEVTRPGFELIRITVNYERRDINSTESPFDEPPKIGWRTVTESDAVETDYDGNPLITSSYQGLDPPYQRDFNSKVLIYSRWEATYNEPKAEQFENTVNNSAVTLFNGLRFEAGRMRLMSYEPVEEYALDAPAVRVAYTFLIKRNRKFVGDAHQLRVLDQGTRGFYQRPDNRAIDTGYVTTPGGDRCTTPVLLDGTGRPLDPAFKVEGRPAVRSFAPQGATLEVGQYASFLVYVVYPGMPFSGLGLG